MKASKLIEELQKQIDRHGDRKVYFQYDGGMSVKVKDVDFVLVAYENPYAENGRLLDIIVINYERDD